MIKFGFLFLYVILPIMGQEATYLSPVVRNPQQTHHIVPIFKIQGGSPYHYNIENQNKPSKVSSLSKLFKPRPPQLDNILYDHGYTLPATPSYFAPKTSEHASLYLTGAKQLKTLPQIPTYTYVQPVVNRLNLNNEKHFSGFNKIYSKNTYENYKIPNKYHNPNNGYKISEELENEPISNYAYSYEVYQPEYGLNFGHQENKEGKIAKGVYHTLLPDGRIQFVEYEADEQGYRPKITYKEISHEQYR